MNNISTLFAKTKFWTKKHSPELLIAGAVISAVGSVVLACFATKKAEKIVKDGKLLITNERRNLEIKKDNPNIKPEEINAGKRSLTMAYVKTGGKLLAVYSPAVLTLGLSISCMLGSHHILRNRNIALAAAYTTLDNGYRAYRKRVQEKLGEEVEEKIYKDVRKEKVEYVDENGKKKTKTVEVPHAHKDENFCVLYGCGNRCWERSALLNFNFLVTTQAFLNRKLQMQGYLFLNEVYDALGFDVGMLGKEKAQASHSLGWIYDPNDSTRDSYVSFGITHPGTDVALPKVSKQIEYNEPEFWLEMNVDGNILNGEKIFVDYAKEGF